MGADWEYRKRRTAMKCDSYRIDTSLVKGMKVMELFALASRIEKAGGSRNAGVGMDLGLACLFVRNDIMRYRFESRGWQTTVGDLYRIRQVACEDFIQIHRLNYVVYNVVQSVADRLDDKGLLVRNVKKFWRLAESTYDEYMTSHKRKIDRSSWNTVQDHCRMVFAMVEPRIEPLSNAVRDYLIQHRNEITSCGQKDDIAMLTDIYVVLMFCAALRNTRKKFVSDIIEQKGIDFSCETSYADIDGVCRNFVWMMQQFGFRFGRDKDGDLVPDGVDISKSVRVDTEWNRIVDIVTDSDLMDRTALDAINMNPETKADYEARMACIEQKELDSAIEDLSQKYNVVKS